MASGRRPLPDPPQVATHETAKNIPSPDPGTETQTRTGTATGTASGPGSSIYSVSTPETLSSTSADEQHGSPSSTSSSDELESMDIHASNSEVVMPSLSGAAVSAQSSPLLREGKEEDDEHEEEEEALVGVGDSTLLGESFVQIEDEGR